MVCAPHRLVDLVLRAMRSGGMLGFTGSLRVFVALGPWDMRKVFDGLSGMVASNLNEDLQSRALFVFSNRSHTRLNAGIVSKC